MNFQFDHKTFARQLLPPMLRGKRMIAWMGCLVKPLKTLYTTFLSERVRLLNEASYNSQEMLLEYILNENFDYVSRRITITTNAQGRRVNAYLQSEGELVNAYLQTEGDKTFAYLQSEIGGFDFTVTAPAVVIGEDRSLKVLINKYKLGGKQFEIIYQ